MKNLIETIDEYNKWKSSIKKVLDENFLEIISLVTDAFGENTFISMYKETDRIRYQPQKIKSGILINRSHIHSEPYIWFFKSGSFYLIEKNNDSAILNIHPYFSPRLSYNESWLYNSPTYKARFDNEVSFIIDFLEWHENLLDILIKRMQEIDPSKADKIIKKLASTAK